MIYCIPYLLLTAFFGGLSVYVETDGRESVRRYVNMVCIGVLLVFFGFRGYVMDDWISYYPAYQKCSWDYVNFNIFEYDISWGFEPGFTLLMMLCKTVSEDYQFLVFVCSLINTTLLFTFFKSRTDNFPFAIVLFLCFGGFVMNTNLLRNSISILLFVNSLQYITDKKPLPFFALNLLGLSFHVSSLIYFPLYFLLNRNYTVWVWGTVFLVANVVFLLHIPILVSFMELLLGDSEGRLQMMAASYTSGNMDEMKTFSVGYIERLFTGILVLCYYKKLCSMRKEGVIFINSYLLYISMSFFLSEFSEISLRMSNLFIFAYWIMWKDMTEVFSIENNRKLFMGFVCIYCALKMVGTTNLITAEYDNVLFGAKSYEERLYIHNRYSKN